jgi:hypothetical protein
MALSYDTGLIKKINKQHWDDVRKKMFEMKDERLKLGKFLETQSGPKPLNLQNFNGAFSVLFPSFFVAFWVFLVEVLKKERVEEEIFFCCILMKKMWTCVILKYCKLQLL